VKSAPETANRGYVLQNGKVMMDDESSRLLQNREVQKMYLGEENV
jgi:branched-chain amino acid transport system ATP-binding protein